MVLPIILKMSAINVVMDTNVLVAALRSKRGGSYRLLMLLADDIYVPNISVPLFIEYESVLKREGMVPEALSKGDIEDILDYLLSKSSIRKVFYLWRPLLKDPKDDLVLEVAVESQSEYIITFNKKDFRRAGKFGIKIVTPKEFLQERGILQ
jgi:putative PIN family toxin of toxin-antitoxin system